jgi:PAS domain S-box-containing protein
MTNVQDFPKRARTLSEYDGLLAAAPTALDAIPGAVYVCDSEGWLVRYNAEAAELWGRAPELGNKATQFCGSHRLFLLDGTQLPHSECPMADAIRTGAPTRNAEVVMERPDGSRFTALVNIRALRDAQGGIQGAINCFQDITDRKALEEELRRKTKDLDDFFENSAVSLHIVSGSGIILRANKAELDLLGYSAEEYIGRHIAEFHADAPVIGDILHRLSCGAGLDNYPARLRAKDGSIRHVLITSNGRFENGRFINTRCFTIDVTKLREAEAAQRDSEERLQATYQAATVGISEIDHEGRFLRVNDALCNIVGLSREQLLCGTFLDYTHPDDRGKDAALYHRQVEGELENYSLRKRGLRRDGETVYLDVLSSSVRDDAGRFRYGVRVVQDVTEAKRLDDQIRDSERQMRELLESLPAAVYTTDSAGRITFYNKAAVEMAGRTPDPSDQWCVTWRLYWPDGTPLPHDQCPMAIALKENRPVRGVEAVAERPDGTRVPFIPYPTPLRDAEGKLVGAINMLVDITERKQAENRQKTLVDELNHRVKNTLATVQSLALQTARHAGDLPGFLAAFETRLLALARAHDLLTKSHWQRAPLGCLVREIVAPLTENATRVAVAGPRVELDPRTALSFTMALNELLTNAGKYGSLSSETGRLSIGWDLQEENGRTMLQLEWSEQNGPPVICPERRGFGTRLLERCIVRDLDGRLDLAFEPEGVRCTIAVPYQPS